MNYDKIILFKWKTTFNKSKLRIWRIVGWGDMASDLVSRNCRGSVYLKNTVITRKQWNTVITRKQWNTVITRKQWNTVITRKQWNTVITRKQWNTVIIRKQWNTVRTKKSGMTITFLKKFYFIVFFSWHLTFLKKERSH